MKYKEIGLIVVLTLLFIGGSSYIITESAKPVPAKIEKIATVNMGGDSTIEVIGIKHRGTQCYLVVGNTNTRLINMKADLVCP